MLSYIEISRQNLLHNFSQFRKFVHPRVKIVSLVKANAYGHGMPQVVSILEDQADYFQVDDLLELEEIRKITQKPVLVFGCVAKDELEHAIALNGTLAVYDRERSAIINTIGERVGRKIKVHIKIDANLGRQGVLAHEAEGFVQYLKTLAFLDVEGVYAHFANIEDTSDFSHAQKQIKAFHGAVDVFKTNGFADVMTHISASSGILVYEKNEGKSDLVRLGISQFGMWPSEDLRQRFEDERFTLKPIMRWVTHIAQVKTVPAGYSIGYGLTHVTERETKIAVIPQGYSDGYDRGFSNCGDVLIGTKRCRVLGRVAMNMFVADVSQVEGVQAEDEVVLLGKQGSEEITAEELAEKIGTINYEITTRILSSLPRKVVQ